MNTFEIGALYTRKEVHQILFPGEPYPGASWSTGYLRVESSIIAFANIGTPGKDGRDYPNSYNSVSGKMNWFGKTNAHSAQPTFRQLFEGTLSIKMFVRWDNKDTTFTYLGTPVISRYVDAVPVGSDAETIMLNLRFNPEGDQEVITTKSTGFSGVEGGRQIVTVNRYERDPRLRVECLNHYGSVCRVCSFDFEATYGAIGRDYCHIHHTKPLATYGGTTTVNSITDLVPLCPNCHAMIHRRNPALDVQELKAMLKRKPS
jgi:5-methylcytosine-specific restriction protein A